MVQKAIPVAAQNSWSTRRNQKYDFRHQTPLFWFRCYGGKCQFPNLFFAREKWWGSVGIGTEYKSQWRKEKSVGMLQLILFFNILRICRLQMGYLISYSRNNTFFNLLVSTCCELSAIFSRHWWLTKWWFFIAEMGEEARRVSWTSQEGFCL